MLRRLPVQSSLRFLDGSESHNVVELAPFLDLLDLCLVLLWEEIAYSLLIVNVRNEEPVAGLLFTLRNRRLRGLLELS
jgi:hypothetical protein